MSEYKFKIYLVDGTDRSVETLKHVKEIFEDALKDNYSIEIIDILKNPELASKDKILASPTLILELPESTKRVIGKIPDKEKLLLKLNIQNHG